MDWEGLFKKVTIIIWMLCLINLLVLIVRYTTSDIGMLLPWNYPLIWAFVLGRIFCISAIFWPKKKK